MSLGKMIQSGKTVEMYVSESTGASSCYGGYPHSNVVYGNSGTWCSRDSLAGQGWSEHIDVSFPGTVELEKVEIFIPQGYQTGRFVSSIFTINEGSGKRIRKKKLKEIYKAKNPNEYPFQVKMINNNNNNNNNNQNLGLFQQQQAGFWTGGGAFGGAFGMNKCLATIPIKKKGIVCKALRIVISESPGNHSSWIEVETVRIRGKLRKKIEKNDRFIKIVGSTTTTTTNSLFSEDSESKEYPITRNITPKKIEFLKKKGLLNSFTNVIISTIMNKKNSVIKSDRNQQILSFQTSKDYECLLYTIFQKPENIILFKKSDDGRNDYHLPLFRTYILFHETLKLTKYENLVCITVKEKLNDLSERKNVEMLCQLFIDCFKRFEVSEEEEEEETKKGGNNNCYNETESRVTKTRLCSLILGMIESHEKRNSIKLYLRNLCRGIKSSISSNSKKKSCPELDDCLDILVPNESFDEELEDDDFFPNLKEDVEDVLFDQVSEFVFEKLCSLSTTTKKKKKKEFGKEEEEEEEEGETSKEHQLNKKNKNDFFLGEEFFQSKFAEMIREIKKIKDENMEIKKELKEMKSKFENE